MRDKIVKAKLKYFINWFSSIRSSPPIFYSPDGKRFSLEYKYIEPINSTRQSSPHIDFKSYYVDPDDYHGEHDEEKRRIGIIDIIERDNYGLQFVFEKQAPEFDNVIIWFMNEIEKVYIIEPFFDKSDDSIPKTPLLIESVNKKVTPISWMTTVDNAYDSIVLDLLKNEPLELLPPWKRIPDLRADRKILKLWHDGNTNSQIGKEIGYSANSVTNALSRLRRDHGPEIVPTKEMIVKSKYQI